LTTLPRIAIIGAGFGGLAVAIELKRAGFTSFTVFERAEEVGGVWQANTYPGAACDVPSVIYQFSRYPKTDWSRRFGSQREIRDYLQEVSVSAGIRDHIRLNTAVTAATFDEQSMCWVIELGGGETTTADIVVFATGQLSEPAIPMVEGMQEFGGAQFHSAEWQHGVDLSGKRVAVVGGGASSIQVVPAVAAMASHVTVVQRSPSWIVGKHDWAPLGLERVIGRFLPSASALHRLAMWWWFESRFPLVLRKADPVRTVWEAWLRRSIRRALRDPRKIAAATPDYALGCNRILLSNQWYGTIARPDVDLIRSTVVGLDPRGLRTSDGHHVEADVVIWCTGFKPTEYLSSVQIKGLDELDIRDAWRDGPEAYLGISTPGFPNMFMSYGPNTGSLTNTIVSMLEYQARFIRQAVEHVSRVGAPIDVTVSAHSAFNAELQARLADTVFTTGCPGWYTTPDGKVTTVWVGSHVEYRRRTRTFDPAVYKALSPNAAENPVPSTTS